MRGTRTCAPRGAVYGSISKSMDGAGNSTRLGIYGPFRKNKKSMRARQTFPRKRVIDLLGD